MKQQPHPSDHVLSALPADLLGSLFAKGRAVTLASDQVLFLPGDPPDGCYRVDEGLLKVCVVTPAGGERILAILGAGAMIGELSMIDGSPRSALVTALRSSRLTFISRAAFETFARDNPEVYRHGMMLLARRLRETNGPGGYDLHVVAGAGGARAAELGRGLREPGGWRAHRRAPEGHAERARRDGRHRPGECQPHPDRLDAPLDREPPCRLSLH
jgi:CRP-like cAMP-binding protein